MPGIYQGPPFGIGVLTAGVVLAIMVLPFIAATMRDVFDTCLRCFKESGTGWAPRLGKLMWNVVVRIRASASSAASCWVWGAALRRDHGRDLRDRQRASNQFLAARARHDDFLGHRQRFTEAVGDLYTSSLIASGCCCFSSPSR